MTLELTTPEIELNAAVSSIPCGPEAERRRQLWGAYRQAKSQTIERFGDFKFGLFIHWGLYAQLGGMWKGQPIEHGEEPHVAEWVMHAHRISRREYAALAENFAPQAFSAAAWADLAMQAGMRYVVLTAKHHDGFALYNSTASRFNSCRAPRFRTDVVAELQRECQRRNLGFGVYYSHSIDWMDGGDGGFHDYGNGKHKPTDLHDRNDWDPAPTSYDDYIRLKSLPQVEELLRQYPDLCCVWFDGGIYTPEKYSFAFYEAVHRLQPQTLVSARVGNNFGDFNDPGDNVIPHELTPQDKPWEAIGTINNSWGFKSYDHDWKEAEEIFLWLLEVVSKGGNFMLNMGPDGQGRIPSPNHAVLQRLGAWLRQNGEAIYGTRPCSVASHRIWAQA